MVVVVVVDGVGFTNRGRWEDILIITFSKRKIKDKGTRTYMVSAPGPTNSKQVDT